MDRQIIDDLFVFVSIIVGMGCFTGILTSYFKWRRGKAVAPPELMARLDEISQRLARLETGVDSSALEIERISEGQRFTTKLLAERSQGPVGLDRDKSSGNANAPLQQRPI